MTTVKRMFPGESDPNPNRCTHIDILDNDQGIRRCNNNKRRSGKEFCSLHAYAVTYAYETGEATDLFDSIEKAEEFRKKVDWSECNYVIPEIKGLSN